MKYAGFILLAALLFIVANPIWKTDLATEYRFAEDVHSDLEDALHRIREERPNARPLLLIVRKLNDETQIEISYIRRMDIECAIAPKLRRSESSFVSIGEERFPVLTEYDLRYTIDRQCGKIGGTLWWRPRTPLTLEIIPVTSR